MDSKRIGMLAVIAASIMWALEPIFGKLAYAAGSDFLQTSAVRAFVVATVAAIYVILMKKPGFRLAGKQVPKVVYIGIIGTVVADALYFFSLAKLSVVNVVMIGHLQPVFIIIIGFFILREDRITKSDYLGVSILMAAGLLVTTKTFENLSMLRFGTVEDIFVLVATVCWASTAIAARKYLRSLDAGVLTFYRYLTASAVFAAYFMVTSPSFAPNVYQVLVGLVVCTGTILYYEGLKRVKAAQVSALELSTPFFAALLGFFVLGEAVTTLQVLGIAMLAIGVYFLAKKE
jgi:drug/metabolite transporter (DMT)-like permease